MRIEIVNLSEKNLADAPQWNAYPFSCKYCTWWEFPEVEAFEAESVESEFELERLEKKKGLLQRKLSWLQKTSKLFGNCGKLLYTDGIAVGYSQYAPPEFLPRLVDYQANPPSEDAVIITCLFIPDRKLRRAGLGSKLLQSILSELRERGVRAVETFARKGRQDNPSGPVEFYFENGFRIYKDDEEFPLMRLDL